MQGPNYFHTGGFVIHKITGDFKGTISAWFNKDGKVLDAEQYPSFGKSRYVKKDGPIWKRLAVIGSAWAE